MAFKLGSEAKRSHAGQKAEHGRQRYSPYKGTEVVESLFKTGTRINLMTMARHPSGGNRISESWKRQAYWLLATQRIKQSNTLGHPNCGQYPGVKMVARHRGI